MKEKTADENTKNKVYCAQVGGVLNKKNRRNDKNN